MVNKISFTIDGQEIFATEGMSVLDAALENNIYIPNLCHHPDLKPVGVCRLCGIENEGRMQMACITPVANDLKILTNTPQVVESRKISLELLIANHNMECLSCARGNDCELLKISSFVGVDQLRINQMRKPLVLAPIDNSNPFFLFDPNKCVLCGICVRTCEEIQGRQAIDFINRGYGTTIGPFGGESFKDSICESCGECVVRCPVGALAVKNYREPSYEVESVCSYCGVGCGLILGVQGNEIVNVRGNRDAKTNNGELCVKGRFGYKFVDHPDRLTQPKVRQYLLENDGVRIDKADRGEWVDVDWETAIDVVSKKFSTIKKESGSDAIGVLASAKCTNEENYLFQKFARQIIGTHSVDHCARL
jgi:formate dehydrogenase (NADP+) alpha subunit